MMRKSILFILLFTLTLSFILASGRQGVEPDYKIRRVSPDGGLGTNGQRDVRQDKWGFIWIITVNNLFRFDGYTFKFYTDKLKKHDSSVSWSFERLEIDANGDIYVTTNFGLLRYDPLTDNFDYLLEGGVNLIQEDFNGRLWMSNPSSIGLFDRETFELTPVESEEGAIRGVSAIYAKENRVFVGTSEGEIYLYKEEKDQFIKVFERSQCNIVDFAYDNSVLYTLTESQGLFLISSNDYKELKNYDFFYPDGDKRASARALFIDKFDRLWITSQRGIYILDTKTDKYIHYFYDKTDPYGLPSSSVWRISEDNQGNLWFGTYSGGLCFVNLDERKKFRSFNDLTDDLSYSVVSSFEEDTKYLWIGTEGGGLNRFDKKTGEVAHFKHIQGKNSLSYDNIQSLIFSDDTNLWIGMSRGGLDRLNTKTGEFTHYSTDNGMLLNDHVERIVVEKDSGLWIKYLMNRDYLTFLSKDNQVEHFSFQSPAIPFNGSISDIQRGNGDTLWVASSHQLLIKNVHTNEVSAVTYRYSEIENTPNINILTILADNKKHIVWIGTNGNGLLMYDVNSQSLYNKADLSKYNVHHIYSINQDKEENLWMGTNNGLFCLDIKENRLLRYSKSDGTQGETYYPFSTYKSRTGELYFGGNEGFTVIDTVQNAHNEYKPGVIITDLLLDNISVTPGVEHSPLQSSTFQAKELTLAHNQNNFSFEFTSTSYINPDRNRFRYRLKGYDNRWIESDANHRSASYAKVPRGKYAFEIMTANNDGVWGEPVILQLTVRAAPWLSLWAITGYAVLLLFVLLLILRYYNYQRRLKMQFYLEEQEKKQKEEYHQAQLKFFTNVSHDFRTPLSLIMAALEPLKSGSPNQKYLSVLENNTKRLLALVNELMDFRSLQNEKVGLFLQRGDWNQFTAGNYSDFVEYAAQKNIKISVNYDPLVPAALYFDHKVMEKVILNLLNNAFKYTPEGGRIEVSTLADIDHFKSKYANYIAIPENRDQRKMFGLVIQDNGIGISEASIALIFERYYRINESTGSQHLGSGIGLALVKSLVELHKGYIAIYSERNKGSDIVIGFPVEKAVYGAEDFKEGDNGLRLSDSSLAPGFENMDGILSDVTTGMELAKDKIILLVEDNDDLRTLIAEMLGQYYRVKEVANGREALHSIEDESPDLIITDVMMPELDGIELSRHLKNNMETSHIPIVILTAKTGAENQIEGLHSGADIYLEKPVNKQVLLLTLVNLFRQQERTREYYAKQYFAHTDHTENPVHRKEAEFMKRLVDLIEENLSNTEIDVSLVASSLAMSRRSLYGKVKALTGQSVVEFIRNYRLRKAARILIEENIPISNVMERVGIDNASYFSRIFKKEFGESPSDFVSRTHPNKF